MAEIDVHEAQMDLLRLLVRIAAGEEIVIARAGKPIARLVPIEPRPPRVIGQDDGLFEVPDDFDEPLPDASDLAEVLIAISRRCSSLPDLDTRDADEILG